MLIYLQMIDDPQDKSLFEQIYETYKNAMYHRAYRILHNEQDAEDAVHEAFVAVAKNIKNFSDVKCHKTRAYLVTIIESKAIDIYRKKQRQPHVELIDTALGSYEDTHSDNTLADCILRLPKQQRMVLLLKHAQGLNNREIAKLLGISQAYVRKLEQRGKERLAELCREEGIL